MRIAGRLLRLRRGKNPAFRLGNRARDLRRWEEAAGHYQKALAIEPERAAIWVQYGHALKEMGDPAAAERAYRRALAVAPDLADTHLQLGHALKLQGRIEEAAAAYLAALALDPKLHFASFELFNLAWNLGKLSGSLLRRVQETVRQKHSWNKSGNVLGNSGEMIIFDVSDLIHYFLRARVPTGIQRVQMNVVTSLVRQPGRDFTLVIACFMPDSDHWSVVPEGLFLDVTELAVAGGDLDDPAWRAILSELYLVLAAGETVEFREHAALVNMGTSWWLQNYFLMVRSIKNRYGVRYIPFVHDCIPVLAPQHCTKALTQDFISWLIGVFFHADGFLVNSQATAIDLANAARLLGHPAPRPTVVRLDARPSSVPRDPGTLGNGEGLLKRYGLDRSAFVLFVSTIESRKNHLLAFDAWLALIRKRGLRKTPILVCVGNPGWLVEPAMARLAANPPLRRKVLILSKVSDADLAALYRRSLFTLYPSAYEGWGLPVTESLCHGKVPLITRVSSLPEAGGDFAEYFDLGSADDLLEKLERLIDDNAYRTTREQEIQQHFRARAWGDVAAEIVAGAFAQKAAAGDPNGRQPLPAAVGRYYAMARNREIRVWPGMICGEMYRIGHGWWPPSDWGCWLKDGQAEIAFAVAEPGEGPCVVYLGLRGTPENTADYRIWVGAGRPESGTLAAGEERWVELTLDPEMRRRGAVHITLTTTGRSPIERKENGDRRLVTLGVVGFYVCREEDRDARERFLAAQRSRRLDLLSGRPADLPAPALAAD
ncbi:MAG TPA: tetratricopeptide repeat protein [Stellaceae bacterium]|nr:tetratricopeptide repeat protein [Stellaceae bacterium]